MAVIDELVTILGIDLDPSTMAKLKAFNEGLDRAERTAIKLTAAVTAAVAGAAWWLHTLGRDSEQLVRLSQQTGVSTDAIQGLSYAVEQLGGNANSLSSDLVSLRKGLTSIQPGQITPLMQWLVMLGAPMENGRLKIRDVSEAIDFLASRLKKMSPVQQSIWSERLGISVDTVRLLMQGADGIEKLKQQAADLGGIIPEKALVQSIRFNQAIKDSWTGIKSLVNQLGLAFLPNLTELIDKFRQWITDNREWLGLKLEEAIIGISKGFENFRVILGKLQAFLGPIIDKVMELTGRVGGLQSVFEMFTTGALIGLGVFVAGWVAANAEILAIIAGITVLIAAVKSFLTWMKGGKSVVGDFFEAFKKEFPALYDFLAWLAMILKVGVVEGLRMAWSIIKNIAHVLGDAVKWMLRLVDRLLSLAPFGKGGASDIGEQSRKAFEAYMAGGGKEFSAMMDKAGNWTADKITTSYNNMGPSTITHDNRKIEISVLGSGNPVQTAEAVKQAVNPHWLSGATSFGMNGS